MKLVTSGQAARLRNVSVDTIEMLAADLAAAEAISRARAALLGVALEQVATLTATVDWLKRRVVDLLEALRAARRMTA